jgi:phytoene dehydrogenase-like protein
MKRRQFIKLIPAAAALHGVACQSKKRWQVQQEEDHASIGHLMRGGFQPPPVSEKRTTDILIIGAGISGLSAARWLHRHQAGKIHILEMAPTAGGNAVSGQNSTSAYPWAAHYLPIPSPELKELTDFLFENNIITGFEKGVPVYNELFLCFDPKERLYYNGSWQEGIIPVHGLPAAEKKQTERFLQEVHRLKEQKGADGKYLFTIPLHQSSSDPSFEILDRISAKDWLDQNDYTSPALHWYMNYCCRDDYGSDYKKTSAWAALHYFAGRRGSAYNAKGSEVLTWPEGNHYLAKKLLAETGAELFTRQLAYSVQENKDHLTVLHYDHQQKKAIETECRYLIMATPVQVAKKIAPAYFSQTDTGRFVHYPWLVANISLHRPNEKDGYPSAWDNVIYNSPSLGYVSATHQQLNIHQEKKVFTYYRPLCTGEAKTERQKARETTAAAWEKMVLEDLQTIHPGIEKNIEEMKIKLWGHGMIAPAPGFLSWLKEQRPLLHRQGRLLTAHTDYCGISIFEEAFYAGLEAASEILKQIR